MIAGFSVLKAVFYSSELNILFRSFFKQPMVWPKVTFVLQTHLLVFL